MNPLIRLRLVTPVLVVAAIATVPACMFDADSGSSDSEAVARKDPLPPCKGDKKKPPKKTKCSVTATVGATGGTVDHPGGTTLVIPPGALDSDVAITVEDGATPPPGVAMLSPTYTFGPEGTTFARPVTVTFAVPAATTAATVYWSRIANGTVVWDRLGATVSAGTASSQVVHFSGGGAGDPTTTHDITVRQTTTYHRFDRIENVDTDFGTQALTAILGDGSTITATATGPGTAILSNVPQGAVWFHTGNLYLQTEATSPVIDLGHDEFGSSDTIAADLLQPHIVHIDVAGLNPIDALDDLEMLVPDANAWYFDFPQGGPPIGDLGATVVSKDWNLDDMGAHGLIDTSDVAVFGQLTQQTSDTGIVYQAMTKVATAMPFAAPQSGGSVSVTLADMPTPLASSYDLRASEYSALIYDGAGGFVTGPPDGRTPPTWPVQASWFNFESSPPFFDIQGVAGGRNVGSIGATADLAAIDLTGAGDLITGTLGYGTPPDQSWDIYAGVGYGTVAQFRLQCPVDATPCNSGDGFAPPLGPTRAATGVNEAHDRADLLLQPQIAPIQGLTINGQDAKQPVAGVGLTPTISWTPRTTIGPRTLATPQTYLALLIRYQLDSATGAWRTTRTAVAQLATTATSITIPAGVLATGGIYAIMIKAELRAVTPGIEPIDEPLRQKIPDYKAWEVSSLFRPES